MEGKRKKKKNLKRKNLRVECVKNVRKKKKDWVDRENDL